MEQYIYWSWPTMILYIMMGTIPVLCIRRASRIKPRICRVLKLFNSVKLTVYSDRTLYYFAAWFIIVFFATVRVADGIYGGADSIGYIKDFLEAEKLEPSLIKGLTIQNYREPGYMILVKILHFLIPNNQYAYFVAVYGIIAFIFLWFISCFADKIDNFSVLPLFIYPFILSFNTLRETLAIIFVLIGIVCLDKNKNMFHVIFWFLIAGFIHFTALLFMAVPFMYWIANNNFFQKKLALTSKNRFIGWILIFFAASNILVKFIVAIIMQTHFHHYIGRAMHLSALVRYIAIALMLIFFYKRLNQKYPSHKILYWVSAFDLVLWPLSSALNFWRADEYFSIIRAIVWCDIGEIFTEKFMNRKRKLSHIIEYTISMVWFSYRIYKTYYSSSLMPYVFEFCNNVR